MATHVSANGSGGERCASHQTTIEMRSLSMPLQGKRLVYREDPVFSNRGWCIQSGSLVSEMQTMQWVDYIVGKCGKIGMTGVVSGDLLIIDE